MDLKWLKQKEEFSFKEPNYKILDTFPNPGVDEVILICTEFTSLCPLTHQPDYGVIKITYTPSEVCVESKSLKLYLGSYRQYGGFAEDITNKILGDLKFVLNPTFIIVEAEFSSRGGIKILTKKES